MKKKIFSLILAALTVIVLATTMIGCTKRETVDEKKTLNFSGYQKKVDDLNAVKGENFKEIDFDALKGDPLAIVNQAIANSNGAKRQSSFIITNSLITPDPNGELKALERVDQRSTFLSMTNGNDSFVQIVSGMMELKTDDKTLNSIVDKLLGMFGYCTRSATVGGVKYDAGGGSGVFQGAQEDVTVPAGALAKWKRWAKVEASFGNTAPIADISEEALEAIASAAENENTLKTLQEFKTGTYKDWSGEKDVAWIPSKDTSKKWEDEYNGSINCGKIRVQDPVTGYKAWAKGTIAPFDGTGKKGSFPGYMYINGCAEESKSLPQYQIDYDVVDQAKSTVKKVGDVYKISVVYKTGESKHPNFYGSLIDQACRVSAGMLLNDTNNTPLKMGRIEYTALKMDFEVWNTGFMKSMVRDETFSCFADFDVFVKSGRGRGYSNNSATQVWSYSEGDCNIAEVAGFNDKSTAPKK